MKRRLAIFPLQYDIGVVGGGVAGIVAAMRCATYGLRVLLCVKEGRSPHALQSVHPTLLDSFVHIGLDRGVIEECLTLSGSQIGWGRPELSGLQREPSLLLDRVTFDATLLKVCQGTDVQIVSDPKGFAWSHLGDGTWELCGKGSGRKYFGSFLINACGQPYSCGNKRLRRGARTLVLRGQWQHPRREGGSTFIDAAAHCWYWGATLADISNLNIFLSPARLKEAKRKRIGLSVLFKQLSGDFRWREQIPVSDKVHVDVMDATPFLATAPLSSRMALVGGAAIRIDPLSSQGIQVAVATAVQAAIAVNTLFQRPECGDDAIAFYQQRLRQRSEDHARFQSRAYSDAGADHQTPFWSERKQGDFLQGAGQTFRINYYRCYRLSREARFGYLPAINGDYIEPAYGLSHPGLKAPCLITNKDLIQKALEQVSVMPLMMVLNHPSHRFWRDELGRLLLDWIGSGVLEVREPV